MFLVGRNVGSSVIGSLYYKGSLLIHICSVTWNVWKYQKAINRISNRLRNRRYSEKWTTQHGTRRRKKANKHNTVNYIKMKKMSNNGPDQKLKTGGKPKGLAFAKQLILIISAI